ncbi:MAG: hypothetical protein ACKOTZ_07960 [Chloroflexota bacterium]
MTGTVGRAAGRPDATASGGRARGPARRRTALLAALLGLALAVPGPIAAPALAATPRSPIGTNLAAIASWSTQIPFTDAFRSARPWISQRTGAPWGEGGPLALTPEGWVASLEPGQSAETVLLDGGGYPPGRYTIRWQGTGTIGFPIAPAEIVSEAPGRIVVRPDMETGLWLSILATDPADPIRGIEVLLPGFGEMEDPPLFHPAFLRTLRPFGILRFMDWMGTNDPAIGAGALGRAQVDDATWMRRGVPMEVIGALASMLDAEPWITVPHGATDAQVRALVSALDGALDPGLRIWLEWSNETWNPVFPQAAYAEERGRALRLSDDPYEAALRYHALRATEVIAIAADAVGRERIVGVLAAQSANPWTGATVAGFRDAAEVADVLAVAPYIDGFGTPDRARRVRRLTPAQLLRLMTIAVEGDLRATTAENAAVAREAGLRLVAYESGQHLVGVFGAENDARLTRLFVATNRDPGMERLYRRYLRMWTAAGGAELVHFTDVAAYGKWGSWGVLERQLQPLARAPKMRALRARIAALADR